MGIGVIVRDYEGELYYILATILLAPTLHIVDPVTVEATTALRGQAQFLLVIELRQQKVKLEGDAIQIVHAMKKKKKPYATCEHIWSIQYCECNTAVSGRTSLRRASGKW